MRSVELYIDDILGSIQAIERYIEGRSKVDFESNGMLMDAADCINSLLQHGSPRLPYIPNNARTPRARRIPA